MLAFVVYIDLKSAMWGLACRINNLVERDIAKRQTASTYLKQLADIGVLQEINSGKEKLFVHPRLMTLMTKDSNSINAF